MFTTGFLIATAKVEEQENLAKFGDEYVDYIKKSKMLIPVLF
jgi:protein-S-isoprenylcysteine O-methyltransferase Ste14